jgi:hypothetical protein
MPLFSPSTRGFYLPELHGDAIPEDAVEISAAAHAALLEAQASGQVIEPGEGGVPVAQAAPAPPAIRRIRSLAFRERLSLARRTAITLAAHQAAAAGNAALLTFLMDQAASTSTDLDDDRTTDGVAALLAAGAITQQEHDALLADGIAAEL